MIDYSICMCNYNMANFLKESVTSIAKCLDDRFEIVIVDDGSTDNSVDVIKQLKVDFNNIRLIELKRSKYRRLGKTRNISIENARGKYVLLHIDCDDIYEDYIKEFVEVFHLLEPIIQDGFLLKGQQINMGQKNFLLKHGPYRNIFYTEDRDLWIRMASLDKLIMLNHKLFRERMPINKTKKLYKDIFYTYKILKQNFETGSKLFEYLYIIFSKKNSSFKNLILKLLISFPAYLMSNLSNFKLENVDYEIMNYKKWGNFKKNNNLNLKQLNSKYNLQIKYKKLSAKILEKFVHFD